MERSYIYRGDKAIFWRRLEEWTLANNLSLQADVDIEDDHTDRLGEIRDRQFRVLAELHVKTITSGSRIVLLGKRGVAPWTLGSLVELLQELAEPAVHVLRKVKTETQLRAERAMDIYRTAVGRGEEPTLVTIAARMNEKYKLMGRSAVDEENIRYALNTMRDIEGAEKWPPLERGARKYKR